MFGCPPEILSDSEGGKLIICRLVLFMKIFKSGEENFKKLISLLEQSFHYADFIWGSASLSNDVIFLANDMRKFGRRTKFQIIYDQDIDEKYWELIEEEKKQGKPLTIDFIQ